MLKRIILSLVFSIFVCNLCFASNNFSNEEQKFINLQVNQAIEKFKIYRSAIYTSLEVTPPQAIEIKKLDKQFYEQIKPILKEDYKTLNKLSRVTTKVKPPKKLIVAGNKKLKENRKILDEYQASYEKELYKILTPTQKEKYLKIKKERLKEYKRQL